MPSEQRAITRGVPTAWAAPPLAAFVHVADQSVDVSANNAVDSAALDELDEFEVFGAFVRVTSRLAPFPFLIDVKLVELSEALEFGQFFSDRFHGYRAVVVGFSGVESVSKHGKLSS